MTSPRHVIAVPGIPETQHEWQGLAKALKARRKSLRTLLSMSYLAKNHRLPFTKILGRSAKDLAADIDAALKDTDSAIIMCGDMGAVLFAMAYRHVRAKDKIAHLTFYNSSLGSVSFRHCYHMPLLSIPGVPSLVWRQAVAYRALTDRPWDVAVKEELEGMPGLDLGMAKAYQALSLFQVKQAWSSRKAKPFPLAPDTRVSIVWGTQDRFFREKQLHDLQALFPSAATVTRDGGHFNHLENPTRFVADILGDAR